MRKGSLAPDASYESKSQKSFCVDHASMSFDHGLDDDKWLRLSFPFPLPHVQRKREQDLDLHGQRDSVPGRRTMRMIHFPLTLPTTDFPNQGQGQLSEFFVQRPIWAMEPCRTLYCAAFATYMLCLYVPYKAVINIPPCNRPRRSWTWKKAMLVSLIRRCTVFICKTHILLTGQPSEKPPKCTKSLYVHIDPQTVLSGSESEKPGDIRGELARAMKLQRIKPVCISGFFVAGPDEPIPASDRAMPDERIIVHLHGGAYWMGTANEKSPSAAFCRDLLRRLEGEKGMPQRAFLVEYRLARHGDYEHGSYPAALLDAFVAYLYLIRTCGFRPENIILSGDSSGGNLALALCRYLRDEGVEDVPGSLLLLSPWCDVSRSHSGPLPAPNPFSTTVLNNQSDVITASLLYRNSAVCPLLGRLPASETYKNPYISPVSLQLDAQSGVYPPHWGFCGFPRHVFINTGRAELNSEQHVTLAHRMAEGTVSGVPQYSGDCDYSEDRAHNMSWRDQFPRTKGWVSRHDSHVQRHACDQRPLENRRVVLDEAIDGVHIYPFFLWFEPERSDTLDRIAAWIRAL